jgi:ATP-dependent Clp protease ATP-binding subunit ClpC
VLALFQQVGGQADLIVCLDDFPSLVQGERGDSNKPIFLQALIRAQCQVIGLLTPREFEAIVADGGDFLEFFSPVHVPEPSVDVAIKLLHHFAQGLQRRFRVSIEDEAVRQAVHLSANYILSDHLPAKALKLLHRLCEDVDYERAELGKSRQRITGDDVVTTVAEVSGVPVETLRGITERSDYEKSLGEVIFGQPHAVREVATELGLIKAGMTDAHKPASVMLFIGQTGTGKTEMAKALARFYSTSKRLRTYALGNCVEPHSVSTIIGVPPGYVGTNEGGRIVQELHADPYCVFLLDEADKAHPDVLQPFLNLFDEGWINDQRE